MPSADVLRLNPALTAAEAPGKARAPRKGKGRSVAPRAPQNGVQRVVATEHAEQAALVAWADGHAGRLPALGLLLAIPNGARTSMSVARRLKAEGLRKGCPDLFLAQPRPARGGGPGYAGLWLEMKRTRGGRVAPEQRQWHTALLAAGYDVRVCRGWVEAATAILIYLGERPDAYGLEAPDA
jgi:hypothetical protein